MTAKRKAFKHLSDEEWHERNKKRQALRFKKKRDKKLSNLAKVREIKNKQVQLCNTEDTQNCNL